MTGRKFPRLAEVAQLCCLCAWSFHASGQDRPPPDIPPDGRQIAEAVLAYREAHGLLPESLKEIVPEFLPQVPASTWEYRWSIATACSLRRAAALDVDQAGPAVLYYVFDGEDAGWWLACDGVFRMIHPPERPVEGAANLRLALETLDRRIAQSSAERAHHAMKVALLRETGNLTAARDACVDWIQAQPSVLPARRALLEIERQRRASLVGENWDNDWSKRPHASLGAWRLFNRPRQNSEHADRVPDALRLPFAVEPCEWYVAEAFMVEEIEHAGFLAKWNHVIELCDLWEREASARTASCDRSYLLFRALARAQLGVWDEARADLAALDAKFTGQPTWPALRESVEAVLKSQEPLDPQRLDLPQPFSESLPVVVH